jgi:hypothetical protein
LKLAKVFYFKLLFAQEEPFKAVYCGKERKDQDSWNIYDPEESKTVPWMISTEKEILNFFNRKDFIDYKPDDVWEKRKERMLNV